MKIYLAAPWFTPDQEAIYNKILEVLDDTRHDCFVPRREFVVKPDDNVAIRRKVFADNIRAIDKADLVLCVTDHKDIGTIWEAGYAYRALVPVLYYAETLGNRLFNLMLAQSGIGVVTHIDRLKTLLRSESISMLKGLTTPYQGGIE